MTMYSAETGVSQAAPKTLPEEAAPQPPESELFRRLDPEAIVHLAQNGRLLNGAFQASSQQVESALKRVPKAIGLIPLAEKVQAEGLSSDDITEHRGELLRAAGYGYAERLARVAEKIGWLAPSRHLEAKITERITGNDAKVLVTEARRQVESAASEVEFVARFDNPRESFQEEVTFVASKVSDAIMAEHQTRLAHGGARVKTPDDTPKGWLGFATKVVRKVKSFFNFFRRSKPKVETEITAYDAAGGMQKALQELASDEANLQANAPMLKRYLFDRLLKEQAAKQWQLALAAPEILTFLFSSASDKPQHRQIAEEVRRNPHELYFVSNYKRHFNVKVGERPLQLDIDRIRYVAETALPALVEVLPTDGQAVRDTYRNLLSLLRVVQLAPESSTSDKNASKTKKVPRLQRAWSKLRQQAKRGAAFAFRRG